MKRMIVFALLLALMPLNGAFCVAEELPEGFPAVTVQVAPAKAAEPTAAPAPEPAPMPEGEPVEAAAGEQPEETGMEETPAEPEVLMVNGLPVLYTARTNMSVRMYTDWDGTEGIQPIGYLPKKVRVAVHALNPTFALVTYEAGHMHGYVRRVALEDPKIINPITTPPYGTAFSHFIGEIAADDAPVTTVPGAGKTLITLHRGARVAFLGFENGYGQVIYHRQYGYIDSRLLGEITAVYDEAEEAGYDAPIGAYTSFYKITTDESNRNRMTNIAVACKKLEQLSLLPGVEMDFNGDIGPYRASEGYMPAGVLIDGNVQQGYGGGTCQVSSTLYNVVLQLPGLTVLQRRAHGANGASYLPIGVDAAVGNSSLNFRFRNDYPFSIRIEGTSQDGALTLAIYKAK
ncbi:MAG: VanW family protein [Clostridia bacterium]|nr:VanW family protein [Clostridia bacterium]